MILPSFLFKNVVKKIHFRIVLDSIYFLQYWLISHGPESSPIVKPNKWLRGDSQRLILLSSLWDGYNFLGTSQFLTVTFYFESFIGGIFIQLFQIYFWALARLFFSARNRLLKKAFSWPYTKDIAPFLGISETYIHQAALNWILANIFVLVWNCMEWCFVTYNRQNILVFYQVFAKILGNI